MRLYNRNWRVLLCLLSLVCVSLSAWGQEQASQATYQVIEELDVKVPMRDGVKLSTNIFRPEAEGAFPVILMRSPYGNGGPGDGNGHFWAERGYVLVFQDTRGRFESEGTFQPFIRDAQDGYDTQQWVSEQPWCNGKIGMTGGSYVGITQWMPAPLGHTAVKSMFPLVATGNCYEDIVYVGGTFQLALAMGWSTLVTVQPGEDASKYKWEELFKRLPLATWDEAIGREIPFLREWVAHPNFDDYWEPASINGSYHNVEAVAFSVGGWYDIFSAGTVTNFGQVAKHAETEGVRRGQKLLMGPWAHGVSKDGKVGDVEFGGHATMDIRALELRWFNYTLKGMDNGMDDEAPVKIFVMGENVWREEQEWPLARTQYTKYYLHSGGKANTRSGDGAISVEMPNDSPPDHYTYDPENPVPTTGGNNLFGAPAGPHDQREVENRTDVLVYSTPTLTEAVEVTGYIRLVLYAASSAPDTDFTAKLVDVHPTGYAQNLTDGVIRARYRESRTNPTLIEPGKVYRYEIDLWVTSNLFLPGHRIRLEVSSSNFPRFDRNPNTGHPFGQGTEMVSAEQTVYHDSERPAHLVLPIIPR